MRFQSHKSLLISTTLCLLLILGLFLFQAVPPTPQPVLPTVASFPDPLPTAADQVGQSVDGSIETELDSGVTHVDTASDNARFSANAVPTLEADRLLQADEHRVIVAFAPNTSPEAQTAYLSQLNAAIVESIPALNVVIIERTDTTTPLPASVHVVGTEPDYYAHSLLTVPTSDPLYADQWALEAIGIPQAWLKLPADMPQITVAVIDSGICAEHPDVVGHMIAGYDYVDRDVVPQDEYGHGCAVAGIIAAHVDNAVGGAGVAPNARILPLRVLDSRGYGRYSDIAAAIVRAADSGAQIINLSLGGPNPASVLENAVRYARSKGVQVVAAAGNTGQNDVYYPAAYPDVIAVGAVDATLQRASYSSYGAEIDALAPGTGILAPTLDGGYSLFSGTSMAAPHISGLIALKLALGETLMLNGELVHSGYVETQLVSSSEDNPAAVPATEEPADEQAATLGLTLNVNSTIDAVDAIPGDGLCASAAGECTLRAAIMEANATTGADAVNIPAGEYVFTLIGTEDNAAAGDLDIRDGLTLTGADWAMTLIRGQNVDHVIYVHPGNTVTVENVSVTAPFYQNSTNKPMVYNDQSTLTLNRVRVFGAQGDGIRSLQSTLNVFDSAIMKNDGKGIYIQGGQITLERSLIRSNRSGGIRISGVTLATLRNSTIVYNSTQSGIGGLELGSGTILVEYNTLAANSGTYKDLFLNTTNVTMTGNILYNANPGTGDGTCYIANSGTFVSGGYNLISDNSCSGTFSAPTDQHNTNPKFAPFGQYGGLMYTLPIAADSPARDAIPPASCPVTTDQRGQPRPQGANCDIGAYEYDGLPSIQLTINVNTTQDAPDVFPGNGICATSTGVCSLRAAVQETSEWVGADIINVPAGHYTNANGLSLEGAVTIRGAGAEETIIDASQRGGVFYATNGVSQIQFEDLTITGGYGTSGNGAGVNLAMASASFYRVHIRDNVLVGSGAGGGIYVNGGITLVDSTIFNNSARTGGAIAVNGGGSVTSLRSTIANNVATGTTGSVHNGIAGGGFSLNLTESTLTDNIGGNGIQTTYQNSISLIHTHYITRLGPLQDNGGPTWTRALLPGNTAIGDGVNCSPVDQRGVPRIDGGCDVGAFETSGPPFVRWLTGVSTIIDPNEVVTREITTQLTLTFTETMIDDAGDTGINDITNPANYRLIYAGANATIETPTCTAVGGDDVAISINQAVANGLAATLFLNTGIPLQDGAYRILACATLQSATYESLDGNGDGISGDAFIRDFSINPTLVSPTDLVAVKQPDNSVILTWTDNSQIETGYLIERAVSGSSNWTLILATPGNTTTAADTNLGCDKAYIYRVRAARSVNNSYSGYTEFLTATAVHTCSFMVNSPLDAPDALPDDGFCAASAGECTLRAAIMEANTVHSSSTHPSIYVPAGTYTITVAGRGEDAAATGDLDINRTMYIYGAGMGQTILDANHLDRIFDVYAGAYLFDMTIRNGEVVDEPGGAIRAGSGTPDFTAITIEHSTAVNSDGGGIYGRNITLSDSVVANNTARDGGGIFSVGSTSARVIRSMIRANVAQRSGGGLYAQILELHDTTISHNQALDGGGIYYTKQSANAEQPSLLFSTISGNSARRYGGGLYLTQTPTAVPQFSIYNSTITDNTANTEGNGRGGGIYTTLALPVTVQSTILYGNRDNRAAGDNPAPECGGTGGLKSLGSNLFGETLPCPIDNELLNRYGLSDIFGQDPLLGSLTDHGWLPPSHRPAANSPALNVATPNAQFHCAIYHNFSNVLYTSVDQSGVGVDFSRSCGIGANAQTGGITSPYAHIHRVIPLNAYTDYPDFELTNGERVSNAMYSFKLLFNRPMFNPADTTAVADVENPNNYRLVEAGANTILETTTCAAGASGDDTLLPITLAYNPLSMALELSKQGAVISEYQMLDGTYRIIACDTLLDAQGQALDGNADGATGGNYSLDFSISMRPVVGMVMSQNNEWLYENPPHIAANFAAVKLEFKNYMYRLYNPTGNSDPNDVTNPANYRVIGTGPNNSFETNTCGSNPAGDDVAIPILSVTYASLSYTPVTSLLNLDAGANGLPAGRYRVIACPPLQDNVYRRELDGNQDGVSGDAFIRDFRLETPSSTPTLLTATVNGGQITLTWTDNSSDETAFVIERALSETGTWQEIGSVAANTTTSIDSPLCGDTYYYRVRAFNATNGTYSTASTFTSAAPDCELPAPANLVVSATYVNSITLIWEDNASDETRYRIEVSTDGISWSEYDSVLANITTYTHKILPNGVTRYYRVRASREGDNRFSDYSNVVNGTTQTDSAQPSQSITVTTELDETDGVCGVIHCSLREAVAAANANADLTTISLSPVTYTLLNVEPAVSTAGYSGLYINAPVELHGNGAVIERSASASPFRLIHLVMSGTSLIQDVTLRGGMANSTAYSQGNYGGALYVTNGTVTLQRITFRDNLARTGAALYANSSFLTLRNNLFTHNNSDPVYYGSIVVLADDSLVQNNTFSSNGIVAPASVLNIIDGGTEVDLQFNTFVDNKTGPYGDLVWTVYISRITLLGNLILNSSQSCDYLGSNGITSNGYNLVEDNTCSAILTHATDYQGSLPDLLPLTNNGGATLTHALPAGHPALDIVPASACLVPDDQRGTPRPQGGSCDSGAYEEFVAISFAAPSYLRATNITTTQVDLAWNDNTSDETAFSVERSPDNINWSSLTDVLPSDTTSYTDTTVVCESIYYYRVRAFRSSDNTYSPYSNIVFATTPSCDTPQTGDTITVTITQDVNDGMCGVLRCSLREAIRYANTTAGAQTVTLPAGIYELSLITANDDHAVQGDLDFREELTLNGAGAATTIIRWASDLSLMDRLVHVISGSSATIRDVTIADAISNKDGVGLRNDGTLKLERVTISNNRSNAHLTGGGIYNTGSLTLLNSAITDNKNGRGAGIYNVSGASMTIENSTIAHNTSTEDASNGSGGIDNLGTLVVRNTTISGNQSSDGGTAVLNYSSGTATFEYVTITDNLAGVPSIQASGGVAGILNSNGTVIVKHSIIANNVTRIPSPDITGRDCGGTLQLVGINLIETPCAFTGATGSVITGLPAKLLPLADNGGFNLTHALQADSPALNAVLAVDCSVTEDQRHASRPYGVQCDLGAFESNTVFAPINLAATTNQTTINLTWNDPNSDEIAYRIERSLDGQAWSEIASVGADVTTYADPALSCFTAYHYRLRAENSSSLSPYTASILGTAACTPLEAATGLGLVQQGEFAVQATWQDNATTETSYYLQRSPDDLSWVDLPLLPADTTTYTDFTAVCGSAYFYRVRAARTQDNAESFSTSVNITLTACAPLAQPTNFTLTVVSPTQLRLTWDDASTNETAYRVERSTDGSIWQTVAALPADAGEFDDLSTVCDITYHYRLVQLRSQDNASLTNSPVSGMTQFCAPPATPTMLMAALESGTVINLVWQDNASTESAYTVEQSSDGGANWITLTNSLPANTAAYQDTTASCDLTYIYRVRAERVLDNQPSLYSNTAAVTTTACPPQMPAAPAAQSIQRTTATLSLSATSTNGATQLLIERSNGVSGSSLTALNSVWQPVGVLAVDVSSFTDTNLVCETTYQYRTRLYRPGDNIYSEYSPVTTIITLPCPVPVTNTVGLYQSGVWLFRDANDSGLPTVRFVFGPQEAGWTAIVGDWDGDGEDGIGLYKNGTFALRNVSVAGLNDIIFQFGETGVGWLPVMGDWNGDDVLTVGVYKDGLFLLRDSNTAGVADYRLQFDVRGLPGALPIVGDWDGNGVDEVGIYQAGNWYLPSSLTMPILGRPFVFGPTDGTWQPVTGDWNADGITTIGVYKAGIWRLRNTNSAGLVDLGFMFNEAVPGWQPLASYRGGGESLALLAMSQAVLNMTTEVTPTEAVPTEAVSTEAVPTLMPTTEALQPEVTPEAISTLEATPTEVIPASTITPEPPLPASPVPPEATAEATIEATAEATETQP